MNSYPPELLTQLAPVMFVAGLGGPTSSTASVPPTPQTAIQSPTPSSPPPTPSKTQDLFTLLTSRLRDALLSQRKPAIWSPDRTKTFHIILVDKSVRFPPRKLIPPEDPQFANAHSPLSPLTPTSPLYPDGLIAPIWIRKHVALVPSVFVLFLRIFEIPPVNPRSPLDPPDAEHERERSEEERRRDAELSAEIAQRKKATNERGIKLTVVLLASRRMLDDPSLDSRLTYIRRQSGLDSKAALFVLSPVSSSELTDFVRSLQDALYEPAVEYYTSHSKRVRRKRNRHSQAISTYNPVHNPLASPNVPRPLRPEGWTVRYEYKMACFAEFRGEDEVALKHYQDAYSTLLIMFGSTAILPPRTKRWAEAKVLADAINVKISKLYLYNNEHALALSHHNSHMRRFADFSRGWGIGEETFEYWSWMARQHRVLAELLEQGSRTTLKFPTHLPAPRPSSEAPLPELDIVRALGMNPSHALQHPGHYYYMAARCTEVRRERFLAVESTGLGVSAAPGYANEEKVDHLTIILELYTKSYELFKKYTSSASQGRLTLWIACRIAYTYHESGKFDMAVRFFERIAKTYRREKWSAMLRPLLATWYSCAQKLGDVDSTVRLLVEMIGYGDIDEPGTFQEDLVAILKSSVPSNADEPLVIDLKESQPLFEISIVFWKSEVRVGEDAVFQLSLIAPTNTVISSLPIDSITIHFPDEYGPVIIRHKASSTHECVRLVQVGQVKHEDEEVEVEADLRWMPGDRLIVTGTVSSDIPRVLKISNIDVTLKEGAWFIEIPHELRVAREGSISSPRWLSSLNPVKFLPVGREDYSSLSVRHRPHELSVSFRHAEPALLDEEYPIAIEITNTDERDLDISVDVLLQPVEVDTAVQHIILDGERSSGLIKGVHFGIIAPGVTVLKTLYMTCCGAPGDRTIDVSIQSNSAISSPCRSRSTSPSSTTDPISRDVSETLQTIVIPTSRALEIAYDVGYRRALGNRLALSDLSIYEDDEANDAIPSEAEAVVTAKIRCSGPWGLEVESLRLIRQETCEAKILECFSDEVDNEMTPGEYLPGDEFCDTFRVAISPAEDTYLNRGAVPGPGEYEVVWRRLLSRGDRGPTTSTRFPLPSLAPPRDELIALLSVPSIAKLHTPVSMELTIRNHHPSRSANVEVALALDPLDGFIVAGLRSGRIPVLLPGGEEKLLWRLIPMECGYVKVPEIKVTDRRGMGSEVETEGIVVKVVDVRLDWRKITDDGSPIADAAVTENSSQKEQSGVSTILVLP
ncbi:Gryzun, putative trafficking through golgi-domain-containing protein [Hygrophoropsis aurantiaca]|uniref:Gryzun, putative trafficking through golgi-domain-containing protein n=1 Tax=Hygrophoropsis aurantiaca TaxID=72124 RepID=A0ACB8A979_9AGAM|nr:Gryzun, putative trafficking through golgi-domain-containing protein [Hygrophoropsis aurantiaca]